MNIKKLILLWFCSKFLMCKVWSYARSEWQDLWEYRGRHQGSFFRFRDVCSWDCSITISNSWLNTPAKSSTNKIFAMLCSLISVHVRLWSRNPDFHGPVQQQLWHHEPHLELQLHWQSSMEMDSRDDDEFYLRAKDIALGFKPLNILEWNLADLLLKVCHCHWLCSFSLSQIPYSKGWNPAQLQPLLSTKLCQGLRVLMHCVVWNLREQNLQWNPARGLLQHPVFCMELRWVRFECQNTIVSEEIVILPNDTSTDYKPWISSCLFPKYAKPGAHSPKYSRSRGIFSS